MEQISFPREWKRQWGFTGASVLQYLVEQEQGDWFHVLSEDIERHLLLYPSSVQAARDRLRADKVVDIRRIGNRYEYHINYDVLRFIEEGQE